MLRLTAVLSLCLAALPAASVRAEGPRDLSDNSCTPAEQCVSGVLCPYAFDPDEPDGEWRALGADCRDEAIAAGLSPRCRDGDELAGDELFCPSDESDAAATLTDPAAPAPAPGPSPPKPKAKGCSVHGGEGGLSLLVLAALGLARRRRR